MRKLTQEEYTRMFFFIGMIIFFGIGLSNLVTNFSLWKNMILSMKVSAILNNLFNFVLSVFFFTMWRGTLIKKIPEISEEQMEEAFKKF